jgi:RNA polymerase sigma factor (sigma-70 family)
VSGVSEQEQRVQFELAIMPHLDAAYNLARWLTRNDHDAEDIAQEAYLRAFRFFGGFRGGDSRAWLLRIVRNTCYTWFRQNRAQELSTEFDEESHTPEAQAPDAEALLLRGADAQLLRRALEDLPVEFREALVLRELEGLSYKEIAAVTEVSMGTVMSRLSRARDRLKVALTRRTGKEL